MMKSNSRISGSLIGVLIAAFFVTPSHALLMAHRDGGEPLHAMGSEFVLGPTNPGKWGPPVLGTGATITWSLMPTGTSCDNIDIEFSGCTITALSAFMPTGFLGALNAAFSAWSAAADLTFIQVADNGVPVDALGSSADIRFGGHEFDGISGTIAHGFFPPENGTSVAGDIHFDVEELWQIGFDGEGVDIFQNAAHEIGHAIGLDHVFDPLALMSQVYSEAFIGPQSGDIAGAMFIYGPPATEIPIPATWLLMAAGLLGLGFHVPQPLRKRFCFTG